MAQTVQVRDRKMALDEVVRIQWERGAHMGETRKSHKRTKRKRQE